MWRRTTRSTLTGVPHRAWWLASTACLGWSITLLCSAIFRSCRSNQRPKMPHCVLRSMAKISRQWTSGWCPVRALAQATIRTLWPSSARRRFATGSPAANAARRCCGAAAARVRCRHQTLPCWCVTARKPRWFAMRWMRWLFRRFIFPTATAYSKPRKRRNCCGCYRRCWRRSGKIPCAARWRRRCLAWTRGTLNGWIRMNTPGMRWWKSSAITGLSGNAAVWCRWFVPWWTHVPSRKTCSPRTAASGA